MAGWGSQAVTSLYGTGIPSMGVVGHPWSGERPEHTQLFQPALQRGGPHGVAVISMEDQRLASTSTDPFA